MRYRALGIVGVILFGLWGCARTPEQGSSQNSTGAEKLKSLEAKLNKLEEDLHAANTEKALLRKKLSTSEESLTALSKQFEESQVVLKEKEGTLKTRTAERDQLHNDFDTTLKEIQQIAGKRLSALNSPPVDPTASTSPALSLPPSGGR